jgi:type II restriction enzyme
MTKLISDKAISRRYQWITNIQKNSGNFEFDTDRLEKNLEVEISKHGLSVLIDHMRLCGNIPENFGHDSTEEKLYSKYTDCLLALSYKSLGFKSIVLKERADAADVEAFSNNYSFVADAKSFRLSRTAKNQKDFKIQAMDGWKRGKTYAMVVCPIYQLPNTNSQIYEQATTRNVCIFTYSHLAVILMYSSLEGIIKAQELLEAVFKTVTAFNPSKNATEYWLALNRTILSFSNKIEKLWNKEKMASAESVLIAKEEALTYFAKEREKIMLMSHDEAINELIRVHKIDNRIKTINAVSDNGLFTLK